MKKLCRYLPLLSLLVCASYANAQSSVDFMVGFGTAHDSAAKNGLDNAGLSECSPIGSTSLTTGGTCVATPSMSGFFLGFGGDAILWKNLGFGGEVTFQPAKTQFINLAGYGPLDYRQTFYDLNAVYEPVHSKRFAFQLQGGVGGARTGISVTQSSCVGSACVNQSQPFVNSNHFQVHVGANVSLFVTEHVFIRPQFDLHYVPNLTKQPGFGSNAVPSAMIWIGYNFGSR